jgi:hypothetical protein
MLSEAKHLWHPGSLLPRHKINNQRFFASLKMTAERPGDESHGETFAARAMSDCVGVRHFEAAFLQIVTVIEDGATDE